MVEKNRLLHELDGNVQLSISDPASIEKAVSIYFNFDKGTDYDKRIRDEVITLFNQKKNNPSYFSFTSKQTKIKPTGFNQIIHILVKRIWDEEEFALITKNPSEINFLENDKEIKDAKVSLEDIERYISNLKILPFVTIESKFFALPDSNKARKALDWLKSDKSNTLPKLLQKLKLIGSYVQTVFYAGYHLMDIAQKAADNKPFLTPEEEEALRKREENAEVTKERKAEILTKVIMHQKEVREGYLVFTEPTLKRNLIHNHEDLLQKDTELKVYVDFLQQSKSHNLKLPNEVFVKCVERIVVEYRELLERIKSMPHDDHPTTNPKSSTVNTTQTHTVNSSPSTTSAHHPSMDFIFMIDGLLHEFRHIPKTQKSNTEIHTELDGFYGKIHKDFPSIEKKYVTLIYLLIKEAKKSPNVFDENSIKMLQDLSVKTGIPEKECQLIYLLIQSDNEPILLEKPLVEFVEDCLNQDEKGILNDSHKKALKSLFASIPPTVKAHQFYTVKEVIKSKMNEVPKKKMVDSLAELIHSKIREIRTNYVIQKTKAEAAGSSEASKAQS